MSVRWSAIVIFLAAACSPAPEVSSDDVKERPVVPEVVAEADPEPVAGPIAEITGRVMDDTGAPVAGALVEWGLLDAEYADREATETGADGTYTLPITRAGAGYRLAISKTGYAPQYWVYGAPWVQTESPATDADTPPPMIEDAVLEAGHWLEATVVGEDGAPVSGAVVSVWTASEGDNTSFSMPTYAMPLPGDPVAATTDENGVVRFEDLPAGKVQLRVEAPYRWLDEANYDVDAHQHLTMGGSGIQGQVRVQLVNGDTGEPVTSVAVTQRHRPAVARLQSEDGVYLFPGEFAAGGAYTFQIYGEGFAPWRGEINAEKVAYSQVPQVALTAMPSFKGQFVNSATGEPIKQADIVYAVVPQDGYIDWQDWENWIDGRHGFEFVQRATTDDWGIVTFCEDPAKPGTLFINEPVLSRCYVPGGFRPKPGDDGVVRMTFGPGAVVQGALDMGAFPYVPTGVSVASVDSVMPFQEMDGPTPIKLDGTFEIARLNPGKYQLHVWRQPSHFVKMSESITTVSLKPGEQVALGLLGPAPQ